MREYVECPFFTLQARNGLREQIVAQRQQKMAQQRQRRKEVNRHQLQGLTKTINLSAPCSVIDG